MHPKYMVKGTGRGWFFFKGKGGREGIAYGFKGKGTTTHLLVDGNGCPVGFTTTPANDDERQQVEPLFDKVQNYINNLQKKSESNY